MKKSSRSPLSAITNPKMRPPTAMSPSSRISSRDLHTTGDSDISQHGIPQGDDPGVRYITESLIQKLSKQENLASVFSLNLSLSKDGGKMFKFIENLEKCERLEVLNLSHNLIHKMEKLEKQSRLRELNLSHNRISKIEALEHMLVLQKLNLAANDIEHIPAWMGKKLKALRVLNLRQNLISSLQDVSRLKPLRDLSSLVLADNPLAALPHYRLFVIFHLRSLSTLDGQEITSQERQEAHHRFHLEELEKLEKDLEKRAAEVEELQGQKARLLSDLHNQEEVNKTLQQEVQHHKTSYKELERKMDTKSQILKQKTLELTRACQKQYQLEQELAFYKIDAKFEPLGYLPAEEVEAEDVAGESPYIGKARYKRNQVAAESYIPDPVQLQLGTIHISPDEQITNQQIRARMHTSLQVDLGEKERSVRTAEAKLMDLQRELIQAEEQIVRASEELEELEEAVAQRKMSEAEKENLRQQLSGRIHLLNQLRDEAQELETQMERQRREMERRQREIHELQRHLDGLSPQDPRHSHVTAQKISKEQQLEMMDKQYKQLEGRLDDMLSRISRETEEIRDLEQQLTEGQIAANEALKRDLEGIISGLQDYLESVKGGARQAQEQCRELQAEREVLLHRMEAVAQEAEHRRQEVEDLERSLQEVNEALRQAQEAQEVNEALRQAQEAQQEAQEVNEALRQAQEAQQEVNEALRQAQEAQVVRLQQELQQQQAESSALKTELERERRAMERAMTKVQDRERDSKRLLPQVQALQEENASLKLQVGSLGARLCDAVNNLVHPEQIIARVSDLKRKLQAGAGEVRSLGPSDVLGQNLAELQQQVHQMLAKSEEERMEAQERERRLQEEVEALQERARQAPQDYKRAAEAKMELEKRQHEATARQLENEVRLLSEKLQTMDEIQVLAEQQLLEAEEERDRLLEELRELEAERRVEDSRAQKDVSGLDLQLKELKRSVAKSDLTASAELTRTKDQLQALHSTVHRINRERAEEKQEVENYNSQAARAARDLAKAEAEIELLQDLLHDKEKQLQEELQTGLSVSNSQQLNHTLQEQRAQVERLKHLLEHTRSDNAVEMEDLLDEIESLRRALGNQSDYISSAADPSRRIRYWCYPPPPSSASAHDSVSTKDSGISLHSPARCPHRKQEAAAPGVGGRWVCSLCRGLRDDEAPPPCTPPPCPPPGSVIYTVFPDGSPAPPGTVIYGPPPPSAGGSLAVIYGPPPTGAHLVYGPPPPHFTTPIIPAGVLHCNVAAHQELEHEVSRLEDLVHHLEDQRGALQREGRELRDAARKRTHRDLVESLKLEMEMERCLHHHGNMEDEICCLEETLLRRRAELREADRVLAQAQEKTMGLTEKYNETKQQLRQAERDAEELERRAQDTAINLVKADQQLRTLQSITCDLEQQRAAQENALQSINSVMAAKDAEYQSLTQKMEATAQRLQKLQDEIVVLEMTEVERLRAVEDMETLALERLQCQEEAQDLHSHLEQKKAELQDLHCHLEQKKAELQEVLQEGEQALARRRQDIQEVKSLLEDVSAEKEEASAELRERRAQLSSLRLEVCREEAQVHQQRAELQRVLEMQQIEDNELKALKLQHNQKMIDLEKTQSLLLQGKQELQQVQERVGALSTQRQDLQERVDALSTQRQDLQERVDALSTQQQDLQERVDALSTQQQDLQDDNLQLQQRLVQRKRELSEVEAGALRRLEDQTRELDSLKEELRLLQQDVQSATNQQSHVLQQKAALHEDIVEATARLRLLRDQERTTDERLRLLQRSAEEKELEAAQQDTRLKQIMKEMSEAEEQLRAAAERLDTERQNHQNCLDLITQKVLAQEQCAIQLQEEGRWCAALEEELDHARRQMLDREAALETCRGDMRRLQQEASARRTREEERTAALRETISRQQLQLQEAQDLRRENRSLKQQLLRMEETQERNHLLQSECNVLQEQLRSQEEVNEAMKELKAQVKLEIQKSVQDLDPNTHPLLGAHWRGELLREKLLREEERLKVLLQQGVSGQVAALGRGRQQTEGSIMRLRRRLDALQDLVSSPSHSQNSLGQDFHSDSSVSPHPTESSEPHRTRTSTD